MSFFKKKIEFPQFVANVIYTEFEFLNKNIDKMIPLADEFNVLTEEEKEKLKEFSYTLVVADVFANSIIHFDGLISGEDGGNVIGALYVKYLKEVKKMSETNIEKKTNRLIELIEQSEKVGLPQSDELVLNEHNQLRYNLCSAFAKMYSGDKLSDEQVRGKNFAAFKLAKSLMKADLVGQMLKDYKVKF